MLPLIELQQITKSFHTGEVDQLVLKGINLIINPGEQVAVMGHSGSGKTTLMNLIGLLDQPSGGRYLLNGADVTTISEDDRAKLRNQTIGFVFQSFFLLPRLTVAENVGLPLYYRRTPEKEARERSIALLERVGLAQFADRRPNKLSGGQQQRVAIARALVGNPKFILADEPTGALDIVTGQKIMDMFKELNQEGVTLIIITHDPDISSQCQRTIYINDGLIGDSLVHVKPPSD